MLLEAMLCYFKAISELKLQLSSRNAQIGAKYLGVFFAHMTFKFLEAVCAIS